MALEDNVPGLFSIDIGGAKRDAKVTFGLVERLERRVLNRPLAMLLNEAAARISSVSDIATVIHEAIVEGGDKRMSRDQVGEAIVAGGASNFAGAYVDILVYALTGGSPAEGDTAEDSKKN